MNCSEFQELLQQRLDGEPHAVSSEFERHLKICSSCRELEFAASRLIEALNARVSPVPREGLRGQIVASVLAQIDSQRLTQRRWRQNALAAWAVAAGLLVAAIVGYSWWSSRPLPVSPGSDTWVKKEEQPAPMRRSLNFQEAGSNLVALVNRTADETLGQSRVLLPQGMAAPNLPVTEPWQPTLEPSTQALRDAQDGVAVGFEPVTSSARRAVSLFLQEIPAMENQKQ
jgi:hypothetical protein